MIVTVRGARKGVPGKCVPATVASFGRDLVVKFLQSAIAVFVEKLGRGKMLRKTLR